MTEEVTGTAFSVVPEWVVDADITANSLRLYCVLARYVDKDGRAWPSRSTLAERMRATKDTVDRCIKELVKIGALTVTPRFDPKTQLWKSNLYTLKVERGGRKSGATLGVSEGPPWPQKKGKNDNQLNENQVKVASQAKPPKRATQLPANFEVDDAMRAWAATKHPHVDVDAETDQFVNHHTAKGSTFKDWTAAWRTWIGNAAKWAPKKRGQTPDEYQAELNASLARVLERKAREAS